MRLFSVTATWEVDVPVRVRCWRGETLVLDLMMVAGTRWDATVPYGGVIFDRRPRWDVRPRRFRAQWRADDRVEIVKRKTQEKDTSG